VAELGDVMLSVIIKVNGSTAVGSSVRLCENSPRNQLGKKPTLSVWLWRSFQKLMAAVG
jgi:hypothetical protein